MTAVREAFPVGDLPVELWAYAAPSEQQAAADADADLEPPRRVPVTDTNQLAASFAWADAAGLELNVYLELDPAYRDPDPPAWLIDLPDVSAPREWQMISFYRFVDVPDPAAFAALLTALWRPLGARGRVYVAREGVNAQMAVPAGVVDRFEAATDSVARLAGVYLNKDSVRRADAADGEAMPFDALHVRVRDQIVADGLAAPLDWSARIGAALSPEEWHARVAGPGAAPGTVVLDCRNDYETDVGAFDAARPLGTAFFRQSWDALRDALVDVPTDAPILTYCTGGIRCVKVAAYLEQELGYTNVARLEGGIVSYARYARAAGVASRFRGKNYVFDGRMAERVTDDVLAACHQCGAPCDDQRNCANDRCHTRFIQCPQCAQRYQSCCSNGCVQQRAYEAGLASLSPRVGALAAAAAAAEGHGGAASQAQPGAPPQQQQQRRRRRRSPLALQPWLRPQPFQSAPLNLLFDRVIEAHRDGADDDSGDDEIVAALGNVARLGSAKDALVVGAAAAASSSGSSSAQAVCEALSGAGAAVTLCAASGGGDGGGSAAAAAWDGDAGSIITAAAPHTHTGSYDLIVVSGGGDGAERGALYAALMVEGVLSRRGLLALPLSGLSAEDACALRRRVDVDKSRVMAATLPVGGDCGDGDGGILFVGWKGA